MHISYFFNRYICSSSAADVFIGEKNYLHGKKDKVNDTIAMYIFEYFSYYNTRDTTKKVAGSPPKMVTTDSDQSLTKGTYKTTNKVATTALQSKSASSIPEGNIFEMC